jgi:hypothetical protein
MTDAYDARYSTDSSSRDATNDRHRLLRDTALTVLRKRGEPMLLGDLAAACGVKPQFFGRTLTTYRSYFQCDAPRHGSKKSESRQILVWLHPHLLVA